MVQHKPWQIHLTDGQTYVVNTATHDMTIYAGCNGQVYTVDPASSTIGAHIKLDSETKNRNPQLFPREVTLALTANGALLVAGYQGYVFGLDPVTLEVQWANSLPGTGVYPVTVQVYTGASGQEYIYAGTVGYVFKISLGGNTECENTLKGRGTKRIDLCYYPLEDWLIVGTNGYVVVLDMSNLGTITQVSLPGCGWERVEVADGGDRIYAASQGYLYQLGPGIVEIKAHVHLEGTRKLLTHLSVYRDASRGDLLVAGTSGEVFCYRSHPGTSDPQLEFQWSADLGDSGAVHVLALDGIVYASNSGCVYGLYYQNGSEMRKEQLPGLGLGEVTIKAYNGYMLMGIGGWLAYSPPPITDFGLQEQFQHNWCWLAATASIASYYVGNVQPPAWTQCKLADRLLGQNSCCFNGGAPACDQPGYTQDALHVTGNFDSEYNHAFRMEHVAEALSFARPVVAGVYGTTYGHDVVITGIHPDTTVDVQDPATGQKSTIAFDTLLNNYDGHMHWGATVSTKP
jgi:hypothetical protein